MADFVADRIRTECTRRGITRSDLARALNMDNASTGYRWRGVREWRLSELDSVAAVLQIPVIDLLTSPHSDYDPNELPRLDSDQQPYNKLR